MMKEQASRPRKNIPYESRKRFSLLRQSGKPRRGRSEMHSMQTPVTTVSHTAVVIRWQHEQLAFPGTVHGRRLVVAEAAEL